MSLSRSAQSAETRWTDEVLRFWFAELPKEQWFVSGGTLDEQIRSRFLNLHRMVAAVPEDALVADPKTALAAVIVLCLLYTSPSPRDRQKSRMPSSA